MAGLLKVYSNSGFTTEFATDAGAYVIPFGTMDGTAGSTKTIALYCKNTGDQPLQSRSIVENSDPEALQSYSIDNITFLATTLALTDLAPSATQIIYVKVTVPAGTTNVGNPRSIAFSLNAISI
ncbi:hypothetical protein [Desulfosporosinus metallidurans]|uniref:Uncharacterized protein n=1 Tax=Desulfosporosinus metallidurans TaxID=1888891 RepID=A0A1Q8QJM1_9FIRM|nr:hypothetical protein [Desulfosporosinus metallidurans]OLN27520.1 hypothetical protein DSOL_4492 [Desulfosporosinus metallidurans]